MRSPWSHQVNNDGKWQITTTDTTESWPQNSGRRTWSPVTVRSSSEIAIWDLLAENGFLCRQSFSARLEGIREEEGLEIIAKKSFQLMTTDGNIEGLVVIVTLAKLDP